MTTSQEKQPKHASPEQRIRILVADDRPERTPSFEAELKKQGTSASIRRVASEDDLVRALLGTLKEQMGVTGESGWDVVVARDPGGALSVERVLALASSPGPGREQGTPVVVVADVADVDRAVACMRLGAADHLHIAHLERLGAALRGAASDLRSSDLLARRLWESEARRRDVLEAMPWLVAEVEPGGRVLSINQSGLTLLGEPGPVTGSLLGLLAEADREAIAVALAAARREASGSVVLARPAASTGRLLAFQFVASPTAWGVSRRISCFAEDVTDRRRAEDRVAFFARRIRKGERVEALGLLASGVAHDFNNVLTDIYCVADAAQLGASPALAAKLEQIFRAVSRGASLTRQILAFSRGQAAEPRIVELEPVVAGMMAMLARIVRQDVRLVHVASAAQARVNADPTQLEQVVLNLVLNARDASPRGASVLVETRVTEVGPERLSDASAGGEPTAAARAALAEPAPGSYVMIRVSDEGNGMNDETKRSLFEPFYSTKTEGRGTGLGLFTVSEIVKGHGGSIVIRSALGKGTSFEVYLPRVVQDGVREGTDEESSEHDDTPPAPGLGDRPDPDSGSERKAATVVPPGWILAHARALGV